MTTSDALGALPSPVRWVLLVPVSLTAGFLAGAIVGQVPLAENGPFAYAVAFLSGLAYAIAALYVTYMFAPTHKHVAVLVLGLLVFMDLSTIHVVMQQQLIPGITPSEQEGLLGVLLTALRANEYAALPLAGVVKVGGVLTGFILSATVALRRRLRPAIEIAAASQR